MTNADIMIQILSEVTEKPKEQVSEMVDAIRKTFPGVNRLDVEVPDIKAEQILSGLREQKEGIRAMLTSGLHEFLLRFCQPQGRA